MDSAGVGVGGEYAEAYDLPLVVDAEGGEQIHGGIALDECVEVTHAAFVPEKCSWISACRSGRCDGRSDDAIHQVVGLVGRHAQHPRVL